MMPLLFLGFSMLVWLPYGIFCLLEPEFLREVAGVVAASNTGTVELRAMYGGLQSGIGLMALLALFRPTLRGPVLLMLAVFTGTLGLGRAYGMSLDGGYSGYTFGALAFEFGCLFFAVRALTKLPRRSPAEG